MKKTLVFKNSLLKSVVSLLFGVFVLSSSSAQVIDIAVDNFAKVDLVSNTALTDIGFDLVGEDSFVREITKPIGRVHIMGLDKLQSCTGTLIREDIVLTASNCLPAEQSIVSANFRLGYLSEEQPGEAFSVEIEPVGYNSNLGYMLLKVDSNAMNNYGFLPLYVEAAEEGSSLKLVQHALSAPMAVTDDCEITSTDGDLFEHNCQSAPGASGGLVFDNFGYPIGMQIEEGLGISLLTLANSNKIIAEMYNLTSETVVDVDEIDESASLVSSLRSSGVGESSLVTAESVTSEPLSELAPVTVETTVTTTPLSTSATQTTGDNTVTNSSIGNTTSSLSAPAQVVWSVLADGAQGSAEEATVYVIRSESKYREVWSVANGNITPMPTIPTVDFANNSVIAVFLGIKPSGGHSVEIATIENKVTGLDVSLQINEPGAGMFATMALTSPWVMVEVTSAAISNLNVIDSATGQRFAAIIR